MPTLVFGFPGRRYHATPWGHHVNEGLVEWPPSPWRILRALISVGYTTHGWRVLSTEARALVERLASVLPTYRVPQAVATHSRHYMPIGGLRKDGIENSTMVFDAWAQIDSGELAVRYDIDLAPTETALLASLVDRLGYLGRSESWVGARLVGADEPLGAGVDVTPCGAGDRPGRGWEQITLMAPETPTAYREWRDAHAPPTPAATGRGKAVASRGKKASRASLYPADLPACLLVETNEMRRQGWSQPPGTRRVLYWRPTDALEAGAPRPSRPAVEAASVEVMLLALATASNNLHALPQTQRTLPQADLLHSALVSHSVRLGTPAPVLTGKSPEGDLLEGHRHAHLLPLDIDGDGHLDHVIVWAPMGLACAAQAAVRAIRRTYGKGIGELRVALAGLGRLDDLRGLPPHLRAGLGQTPGPQGGSTEWLSETPFVAPRFVKLRGRNTIEGQVQAELASRGIPAAAEVEVMDPRDPSSRDFDTTC